LRAFKLSEKIEGFVWRAQPEKLLGCESVHVGHIARCTQKTLIQTGSNNKVERLVHVEKERNEEGREEDRERGKLAEGAMWGRRKII
jgi:hypothetical protein